LDLIDYLIDNYDDKHTISVTDPDSRWMKDKNDKMGLNYNFQVAIDDKNDFIVAQRLVNEPTDHHQLIPMIASVEMNLGKHPDFYTADNGYLTNNAAYYLFYNNIDAIIPDRNASTKNKFHNEIGMFKKANFEYNCVDDIYICPNNQILKYQNNRKINNVPYRVYSTNECKLCEDLNECTSSKIREIFDLANPLRMKMQENFNSDLDQQVYKKRFHTGDPFSEHSKMPENSLE
jgi:hypothetical protein